MPAKLVIHHGNTSVERVLSGPKFTIGRLPQNDLELNDSQVSRHHCEITKQGDKFSIKDPGSANGTFINGERITERPLADGDQICIGEALLVFTTGDAHPVKAPSRAPAAAGGGDPLMGAFGESSEIVKRLDEMPEGYRLDVREALAQGVSLRDLRRTQAGPAAPEASGVDKFYILYQVGKAVTSARNLEEVLDMALGTVFNVINAERAMIMLIDPATNTLIPKAAGARGVGRIPPEELTVSRTITQKVVGEKVSIITSDAVHDPRFEKGLSIIQHNVRSALCVPLWDKDVICGVVYVDNLMKTHAFEDDDLEMLTALANLIAIRVRQEQLFESLKSEAIRRANLERFHSPDEVEWILKQTSEDKVGGLEVAIQQCSILFADIQGFTRISEGLSPKEVGALLSEFFETTSKAISENQGSVNKFIGDCVMAIFGAPKPQPDHAMRAVKAAVGMLKALRERQASIPAHHRVNVRIGINTGDVVAGEIGSSQRREYTVLGDAVNVASRLEKQSPANGIVIGERTHAALGTAFKTRDLGAHKLRGKEKEMKVYEVTFDL